MYKYVYTCTDASRSIRSIRSNSFQIQKIPNHLHMSSKRYIYSKIIYICIDMCIHGHMHLEALDLSGATPFKKGTKSSTCVIKKYVYCKIIYIRIDVYTYTCTDASRSIGSVGSNSCPSLLNSFVSCRNALFRERQPISNPNGNTASRHYRDRFGPRQLLGQIHVARPWPSAHRFFLSFHMLFFNLFLPARLCACRVGQCDAR